MEQENTVKSAPWGNQIAFQKTDGRDVIEKELIPLLHQVLDFLRNENLINIKNKQSADVYQEMFNQKQDNIEQFKQFFRSNIEGFTKEISEAVNYKEDFDYAQDVGKRWVQIKQFMFWIGFFFSFLEEMNQRHLLFGTAFNDIVKPIFFEQHKKNLFKCICNLIDKERETHSQNNPNIGHMIQIFLVCGMEKLIVFKLQEKNIHDPLVYKSEDQKKEAQTTNEFYIDIFENKYKAHLQNLYKSYQAQWWQSNNTPQYVDDVSNYLNFEDSILERYMIFSKNNLQNAIYDIVIIQCAKNLVYSEHSGFEKMIVNKKYEEIQNIYKLFKRISRSYIEEHNKWVESEEKRLKDEEEEKKKTDEKNRKKKEKKLKERAEKEGIKFEELQAMEIEEEEKLKKNEELEIQEKKQNNNENINIEQQLLEKKTHPIDHLKAVFHQYIKEEGEKINKDTALNEKAVVYYTQVCKLKEEVDLILINHLQKDLELTKARDDAFRHFLNKFKDSGNFLAQFCDHYLHKDSSKGIPEEEIEKILGMIDTFVFYLHQKDLFFQQYEQYLSIRLLGNKMANSDHENTVIASFKKEHGAQSMKNCSKMIQDIDSAEDQNKDFQKYLEENQKTNPLGGQFKATLLQKACWPIGEIPQPEKDVIMNPELKICLSQFEQFFLKNNASKKVTWLMKEGEANIQMLTGNKCTFTGSTHHMLFLLAFNKQDSWKVKEIKEYLNMPPQKISQFAKQFLKYKLITMDPPLKKKEDKITADHQIKLVVNFKSDKRRIALNIVRKVEDRQVEKASDQAMDAQRGYVIEANIVKVMKGKRTLGFQELQGEVIKITKLFKPEIKMIKQKIEGLIDKDFLERDPKNPMTLVYKP